jgi:hypothetical protein
MTYAKRRSGDGKTAASFQIHPTDVVVLADDRGGSGCARVVRSVCCVLVEPDQWRRRLHAICGRELVRRPTMPCGVRQIWPRVRLRWVSSTSGRMELESGGSGLPQSRCAGFERWRGTTGARNRAIGLGHRFQVGSISNRPALRGDSYDVRLYKRSLTYSPPLPLN